MTPQRIESMLFEHHSGIATLDQGLRNLRGNFSDFEERTDALLQRVEGSLQRCVAELASRSLNLAIADKEVAELNARSTGVGRIGLL